MITGHIVTTSKAIRRKLAVAGIPARSSEASRAGSPAIRIGVTAQAASPMVFVITASRKVIGCPSVPLKIGRAHV